MAHILPYKKINMLADQRYAFAHLYWSEPLDQAEINVSILKELLALKPLRKV